MILFSFFRFDASGDNQELRTIKFLPGTSYPKTKKITGMCKKFPINISLDYIDVNNKVKKAAEYLVDQPEGQDYSGLLESNMVTFFLRFDHNGLVSVSSAIISYESEAENDNDKMDVDEGSAEKKKKSKPIVVDLSVKLLKSHGSLTPDKLAEFSKIEADLNLADKNWKEKTDAKNALEEFIYEWRDKLSSLEVYVAPEEKESFKAALTEHENWLYEQEDDNILHSKSVYDEKTNQMMNDFANKILTRKYEFEQNPSVLEQFGHVLQQASKFVDNAEDGEEENVSKLINEIKEKQKYFDSIQGLIKNWNPNHDAPVTCEIIRQNMNSLQTSLNMSLNARKRIQEEKKKASDDASAAAASASAPPPPTDEQSSNNDDPTNDDKSKMDVD